MIMTNTHAGSFGLINRFEPVTRRFERICPKRAMLAIQLPHLQFRIESDPDVYRSINQIFKPAIHALLSRSDQISNFSVLPRIEKLTVVSHLVSAQMHAIRNQPSKSIPATPAVKEKTRNWSSFSFADRLSVMHRWLTKRRHSTIGAYAQKSDISVNPPMPFLGVSSISRFTQLRLRPRVVVSETAGANVSGSTPLVSVINNRFSRGIARLTAIRRLVSTRVIICPRGQKMNSRSVHHSRPSGLQFNKILTSSQLLRYTAQSRSVNRGYTRRSPLNVINRVHCAQYHPLSLVHSVGGFTAESMPAPGEVLHRKNAESGALSRGRGQQLDFNFRKSMNPPPQSPVTNSTDARQISAPTTAIDINKISRDVIRAIGKQMRVERERRGRA